MCAKYCTHVAPHVRTHAYIHHARSTHTYKLTVFLALSADDSSFFGLGLLITCTVRTHADGIRTNQNTVNCAQTACTPTTHTLRQQTQGYAHRLLEARLGDGVHIPGSQLGRDQTTTHSLRCKLHTLHTYVGHYTYVHMELLTHCTPNSRMQCYLVQTRQQTH